MKFLTTLVLTLVGAVAVILASPAVASAETGADRAPPTADATAAVDSDVPATALPGTVEEAEAYALREAASPEVQDFAGGDVVIGVSILLIAVIVLIVILLSNE